MVQNCTSKLLTTLHMHVQMDNFICEDRKVKHRMTKGSLNVF